MNITVRNLPNDLVARIKKLATKARRSLNSEILFLLEAGVDLRSETATISVKEQRKALAELAGTWIDDRSTEEIIKDIYESRSPGREIEL